MNVVTMLLLASAFMSGLMNSVAGGGTFFTFPALIFAGIPAITANATCALVVFPASFSSAYAYRQEFKHIEHLPIGIAIVASLIGGILGSAALLATPEKTFVGLIPWLLLLATLLFAFGRQAGSFLRSKMHIGLPAVVILLLVIGFYGGFFGAGIGIMTLALLGLLGLTDLHEMNAIKTILTGCMNLTAVVNFILHGAVYWPYAIFMAVAATLGGYVGARIARKVDQKHVRWAVIAVGLGLTVYFFRA